jgi:hypothetical protein
LSGSPFVNSFGSQGVPVEPIRLGPTPDPLDRDPRNIDPHYVPPHEDPSFVARAPYCKTSFLSSLYQPDWCPLDHPSTGPFDTNTNFQYGSPHTQFASASDANIPPPDASREYAEWRRPTITPQSYRYVLQPSTACALFELT